MSRTWPACTATFFTQCTETPLVNVQISLCQFTESTWSKHRTLLVNAQPPPPCQCTEPPFRCPGFCPGPPLSPYRTPHINAPCLIASHPSGVAKPVHCRQLSHDRQSGPSEARRQAPMIAWLCWSRTNHTQPICINCFFPSQALSRPAIMPPRLAGGDTFLQVCLWEAGHAVTSPGAGFYDWQMRSFDAGSEDRMGLVDYIMRAIEGTCHDRGLCNVRTQLTIKKAAENLNISKNNFTSHESFLHLSVMLGLCRLCWLCHAVQNLADWEKGCHECTYHEGAVYPSLPCLSGWDSVGYCTESCVLGRGTSYDARLCSLVV